MKGEYMISKNKFLDHSILVFMLVFASLLSAAPPEKVAVYPFINRVSDNEYDEWCGEIAKDIEEFFKAGTDYKIVKQFYHEICFV